MLINRARAFWSWLSVASHNIFLMLVLLPDDISVPMLFYFLFVDGLRFLQWYENWRDDNLGLHEVLRILIPQSIRPLALHWLLLDSQVLTAIVLQRSSSELFTHLIKPIEDFVGSLIPKRLVFDIAVDVSTWHVGVSVALHWNLKP